MDVPYFDQQVAAEKPQSCQPCPCKDEVILVHHSSLDQPLNLHSEQPEHPPQTKKAYVSSWPCSKCHKY